VQSGWRADDPNERQARRPGGGKIAPDLLVCDIDALDVDPLEFLRRVRFVLPQCTIAVYAGVMESAWAVRCHLAGANCLLSKDSDERSISSGLRNAISIGCYTDPRFDIAVPKLTTRL
jgi:DNA-binding NarL/FixJ family response regulator